MVLVNNVITMESLHPGTLLFLGGKNLDFHTTMS